MKSLPVASSGSQPARAAHARMWQEGVSGFICKFGFGVVLFLNVEGKT